VIKNKQDRKTSIGLTERRIIEVLRFKGEFLKESFDEKIRVGRF